MDVRACKEVLIFDEREQVSAQDGQVYKVGFDDWPVYLVIVTTNNDLGGFYGQPELLGRSKTSA